MTFLTAPRKLRIELGLDCPLLCVHCSASAAPGNPLAMSTALAERLVDEFAAMGGEEVTFTGGEPFIRADLQPLLRRATSLGLATVVFTSGIVHRGGSRAAIGRTRFSGMVDKLQRAVFSIYSADAARHDAVTGTAGSLRLTRTAIRNAVSAGIRADLHFVPTHSNFRDLPAVARDARGLGVNTIRVIRYVPQGRGRVHQDALRLLPDEQYELRNILQQARADNELCGPRIAVGSGFGYLVDAAPKCTAAVEELVVSSGGRVYPCSGFSAFRGEGAMGDVVGASLASVWENSPFLRAIRDLLEAPAHLCRSGCLAQAAAATGKLTDSGLDPDAFAIADRLHYDAAMSAPSAA